MTTNPPEESADTVKRVNSILVQAAKANASDIHFECFQDRAVIRFRVDGLLRVEEEIDVTEQKAMTRRLKVLSALDPIEMRLPQDGKFQVSMDGEKIDFRVCTAPCVHGESVVLRLFRAEQALLDIASVGLSDAQLTTLKSWYGQPHGHIIVSGPTGSGKTTVLYAILAELNQESRKIMTVEDSVEFLFDGINQMRTNPKIGLTAAAVIRTIMRQDPDVIMLGSVRDKESPEMMARAAQTGHLALTQMHADGAVVAIARLLDVGVDPFMLHNTLLGVLNMRLVRRLCPECKEAYDESEETVAELGLRTASLYRAKGCDACNDAGYRGRRPVYEFLQQSEGLKRLIMRGSTEEELRAQAIADGMVTLWQDGLTKVEEGVTSLEELRRIVSPEA